MISKFYGWIIGALAGIGLLLAAYFTGGQNQKAKQQVKQTENALKTKQRADEARVLTDEEREQRGWKR